MPIKPKRRNARRDFLPGVGPDCQGVQGARPMNRSIIALAAALTAGPAFADSPEYPPGLFEHSPVVPSGPKNGAPSAPPDAAPSGPPNAAPSAPPDAAVPSGPRDADVPFGSPGGGGPSDDFCASVEFRTFHSLAEVRQAHARCDPEAH